MQIRGHLPPRPGDRKCKMQIRGYFPSRPGDRKCTMQNRAEWDGKRAGTESVHSVPATRPLITS